MKVERVFLGQCDDKNILESILYDLIENYICEKYNLNKINNATSSKGIKEM